MPKALLSTKRDEAAGMWW